MRPLVRAFGLSLVFHLCIFGVLEIGHQFGWWKHTFLPRWLDMASEKQSRNLNDRTKARENIRVNSEEVPLIFVQVDPAAATEVAPKNAKYYAAQNSIAANPKLAVDTPIPKIDGRQAKVIKTSDAGRPAPTPLAPQPPNVEPIQETKSQEAKAPTETKTPTELKPQPAPAPGNLSEAKPQLNSLEKNSTAVMLEPAPPPRVKPRRLADVQPQAGALGGEKMQQDGGVKRHATLASLDAKATLFGAYDELIVAAIQQRWYALLEQDDYVRGRSGKVILEFGMTFDGRIVDLKSTDNTVGELLGLICQKAVSDPAPYPPWPPELRRLMGSNTRMVRFTFYYD